MSAPATSTIHCIFWPGIIGDEAPNRDRNGRLGRADRPGARRPASYSAPSGRSPNRLNCTGVRGFGRHANRSSWREGSGAGAAGSTAADLAGAAAGARAGGGATGRAPWAAAAEQSAPTARSRPGAPAAIRGQRGARGRARAHHRGAAGASAAAARAATSLPRQGPQ